MISASRIEELRNHFNKSYRELSDKIDGAIKLLRDKYSQFETTQASLPNYALLYPELQAVYQSRCKTANNLCEEYKAVILGIIDILQRKKSDMINDAYVGEFDSLVNQLSFDYSAFEEVLASLGEHNKKTREFEKSISDAKAIIEKHYVSVFHDEIESFEKELAEAHKQAMDEEERLNSLKATIALMEQEIKNSQIPADSINRDIAFIMGISELVFTNSDLGYRITRNGVRAKHLSKGEENAIALIYFFNTLLDVEADAGSSIIVLDDPISSFDSNFYYNAISYIREKTSQAGQTFIFTHKFSLMKDFSLMFNDNNTNHYTIQRIANTPRITNEDALIGQYHDEYAYLFKKIYFFVKTPPSDISEYLQYPNIARRLLEGFLTFKIPSNKPMIDKVLTLEAGRNSAAGRAILRLLNNHSHLRVISGSGLADDIDSISALPDILKHLLDFMKLHDEQHYNTLAHLSDPQYNSDGDSVDTVRVRKRRIKLFDMPASAGLGNFLDDDPDALEIEVTNEECTFGVRISGDSMVPKIEDGDIVLVKQCDAIPNAQTGVVWYKGQCYCKKVVQTPKEMLLVSENKQYPPIHITELEELHVFGEVVDTIKP